MNERKNTNKKHNEGIRHISEGMRMVAREANGVDEELHQFVSAKFCDRLDEAGLLNHPLIRDEMKSFQPLFER